MRPKIGPYFVPCANSNAGGTSTANCAMVLMVIACMFIIPANLFAQEDDILIDFSWAQDPPELATLIDFAETESNFRVAMKRFYEDRAGLERRYPVMYSPARQARMKSFIDSWSKQLEAVDFDKLNHEGQIDYILLKHRLTYSLQTLKLEQERWLSIAPLVPFAEKLRLLPEARFDRVRLEARSTAGTLDAITDQVISLTNALESEARGGGGIVKREGLTPGQANRAVLYLAHLKEMLDNWHRFYEGYDPMYTWWCAAPYQKLIEAIDDYGAKISRHLVGITPDGPEPIIGDPVLEAGLQADFAVEMIPYNAKELLAIGEREFDWIVARFREVSTNMGFGNDWQAALEHVKNLAPPPGEKPWLIFDIADYSQAFIEKLDNVSWPPLAEEIWRLEMQTPERQLRNPFFSGGENTRVSYPTNTMAYKDRLMSMRGNTPHFNFPTVMHELIPGHHLQGFMNRRFNTSRGEISRTPFWSEGWALYWELLLWDENFARNDADKIGTLFWRLHRAARIVFSLKFQLGEWTPQQCIDFLVEEVGHERANAEAEVRRTTIAAPLYQLAYKTGGLQFRALYKEVVESGKMTAKEFHDAVMQGGNMPVELVRARILKLPLTKNYQASWRWEGNVL